MPLDMNDEMRREIAAHGRVEVRDAVSGETYVLLKIEQFERWQALIRRDALSEEERQAVLQEAGRLAGWNDPQFDEYEIYREQP